MYQPDLLIKYGSSTFHIMFIIRDDSNVISMPHSYADIYLELISARKRRTTIFD